MIKELKYVTIHYTSKDLYYIDELCRIIENRTQEIVDFFDIKDFDRKESIYFFESHETFRNEFNKIEFPMQRIKPPIFLNTFKMRTPNDDVYTLCLDEYKKVFGNEDCNLDDLIDDIMEEFTYLCYKKTKDEKGKKYTWLEEGLCMRLSSNMAANILPLLDATEEEMIYGVRNKKNYLTMINYVLETYGRDYVLKLIKDHDFLERETPKIYKEVKKIYSFDIPLERKEYTIEDILCDLFEENRDNSILLDNIIFFSKISQIIIDELEPIADKLDFTGMFDELPVYSIEERFNMFKQFASYAQLGSPELIDDLINRGIISVEGNIYNDSKERDISDAELLKGIAVRNFRNTEYQESENELFIKEDNTIIYSNNTGLLQDVMILVHEFSHYLDYSIGNMKTNCFNINILFTESIAIALEMIFNDYIDKNHEQESYVNKIVRLSSSYELAKSFSNIAPFIYMYHMFGNINLENFKLIGGSKEQYIERLNRLNYKDFSAFNAIQYLLAGCLSPYLFEKYKENEEFLSKIKILHENKEDISKVLSYIELPTNENDILETFKSSLNNYVNYVLYEKKKKSKN